MANPYVGAQVWHASIIIPSDGDPAVAESVNIALRDLMDDAAVLRTDIAHQAADDRGITSTITGDIVWNDGGGSFESNIPSEFNGGLDLSGNPLTIHSTSSLECNGPADFDGNVTVGNTGTDALIVNSSLTQNGPSEFWDQVTLHTGAPLIAHGDATIDGDTVILGNHSGNVVIDSEAFVNDGLTVQGAFSVNGDVRLGNNASDSTTVNGPAALNNTLDVDGDARFNSDVQVDGNLTVVGDISLDDLTCQDITIQGDCTIGNNSASDTLTINALLTGALAMGTNGRVLQSVSEISSSQTLSLSSPRFISCANTGSGMITLTIDDAGMETGDMFLIYCAQGSGSIRVNNNQNGATFTTGAATEIGLALRRPSGWLIVHWALS